MFINNSFFSDRVTVSGGLANFGRTTAWSGATLVNNQKDILIHFRIISAVGTSKCS